MENLDQRLRKVERILISQSPPTQDNSPYLALGKNYGVDVNFKSFIQVQPIASSEFRKHRTLVLSHSAVIFTGRGTIDHFFNLCEKIRLDMPAEMLYFCITEQTAYYLQKYIVFKKRKVFVGEKTAQDLFVHINKHKKEKFLLPCSDSPNKNEIAAFLAEKKYEHTELVIQHTVANDLSELSNSHYDILTFFTPADVYAFMENFPSFDQKDTRIAAFGANTAKAVKDAKLILDIEAPLPDAPSMVSALDRYIKKTNE